MTFDPNIHITKLPQGKDRTSDYLEVKWRLVWLRSVCLEATIVTELVTLDLDRETQAEVYAWNDQTKRKEKVIRKVNGWCLFKATVTDGKGATATAHGSEGAADFGDYVEKAETKAVGRALAYLGFGTQFTGDELAEQHRIVDTPVVEESASNGHQDADIEARLIQVKQFFATMFKPERWEGFKQHHIGLPVPDEGLGMSELDRLYAQLLRDKQQKKAS